MPKTKPDTHSVDVASELERDYMTEMEAVEEKLDNTITKTCLNCNGSGVNHDPDHSTCSICDGTGVEFFYLSDYVDKMWVLLRDVRDNAAFSFLGKSINDRVEDFTGKSE